MEQKRETRKGQLVFDKGANVLKRKRITSLTNGVGITGKNMKKINLAAYLIFYRKTNLNVTGEIKNSRRKSSQFRGDWFQIGYKKTQKREREKKKDKLNFIRIKSCYSSKASIKNVKKQATNWDKIFKIYTSDRGLLLKICKEPQTSNKKRLGQILHRI